MSITLGIVLSYWIEYGTQYIGGYECLPGHSYTDAAGNKTDFNPRQVGPGGCVGQSEASWRLPFAIQIAPALVLGVGMLFYPESVLIAPILLARLLTSDAGRLASTS